MSGYVDRENTRADYTRIYGLKTDESGFVKFGPSLYSIHSTLKDFEYVSSVCDECSTEDEEVVAWVDEVGEDICPECGMVCVERQPVSHEDSKFTDTRGVIMECGPSLATPPIPFSDEEDMFYTYD